MLERILANPDDLVARLAYADELIAAGEPRGRFIVEQIRLAELDLLDPEVGPLLSSTRRLLRDNIGRWIGEYTSEIAHDPKLFGFIPIDDHQNPLFENGFVRRIGMQSHQMGMHWGWLTTHEPLEGIELFIAQWFTDDTVGPPPPGATDFRVLKLSCEDDSAACLLPKLLDWNMPHLDEVELWNLAFAPTIRADLWRRVGSPKHLSFAKCSMGDAGLRELTASTAASRLRSLALTECGLGPAALALLKDFELAHLDLAGNDRLGGHFGELAGSRAVADLESISLPASVTAEDLHALFPKRAAKLRKLSLVATKLSASAITAVPERLTHLDLEKTNLSDHAFATLLCSASTKDLLELSVRDCGLTDAAVEMLVRSPLERLVSLDLGKNRLTKRAISSLARWPALANVTTLSLDGTRFLEPEWLTPLVENRAFAPAHIAIGTSADEPAYQRLRERFGNAIRAACTSRRHPKPWWLF